ncbi:hypothetical protein B0A48_07828 [Cryoendolithus antarcticus]|uniref:AAA+ ATPase domain-containing protein n=1 Tax=Cryoendolithus antarcticus TaxID=1507870 RepID=A0A1V8T0L6_9PEZI|nr:hypothetical protein B0A48_07828 [Cryoendolithus antarcticus]
MARLQGALDNELNVAVGKFLEKGVPPTLSSLYDAISRSNSSLARRGKKVLTASLERILDYRGLLGDSGDEEAPIDAPVREVDDLMNRSLRANLSLSGTSTPQITENGDRRKRATNGESLPKRQKVVVDTAPPNDISLRDVGGAGDVIRQMKELLVLPLLSPEDLIEMNVTPPTGILLHGPPGCGKTMMSRAVAAALQVPFIEILGPSIVSGMSGESEKGVRDRFEEAKKQAPCIIFIDEIDAIAPKRESSQSQMEKRIVAQLLVSIDDLARDRTKPVIVLAATNRPDSLDPALRRGGRFDTEINMGVPNERTRAAILKTLCRKTTLHTDVDIDALARRTAGFVGADLRDLVAKAGSWQMTRYRKALEEEARELASEQDGMLLDRAVAVDRDEAEAEAFEMLTRRVRRKDLAKPAGFESPSLRMAAFDAVLPLITPSSKREGFATIPDVSWADIGALDAVREALQRTVVRRIVNPKPYIKVGLTAPSGVLLWGPPGCGKTLLAKAVAAESKANFISIKGPELLNKFVGESEAAVRKVFARARSSVPCVIFFDELDALVPQRDSGNSEASSRVVNTLLTELSSPERDGIYVIGATNRPDVIDTAMLRPGRLEQKLFVDLPGPAERVEILRALTRKRASVDASKIALSDACDGFSGADLGSLVDNAAYEAIERCARLDVDDISVVLEDYQAAVQRMKGSVSPEAMEGFKALKKAFDQR